MSRLLQHFGFAMLFTIMTCAESLASDGRVRLIQENLEKTSSYEEIRSGMKELAEINSPESAEAYSGLLEEEVIPLNLPLQPFLNQMYKFQNVPEIRRPLIALLRQLGATQTDRYEKVYIAGLLARFGETDHVSWLISEHRRTRQGLEDLNYPSMVLEALSKANNEEASDYVVDHVLQNSDPTLKLVAEGQMRETGNPRAIDIMRGWPMVENGDVDLLLAEHYLESIIAFGDARDLRFVNWLDHNAKRLFHIDDVKSLRPLLTEAETAIEASSNTDDARSVWLYTMAAVAILLFLIVVGYVFKKRDANRTE